MYVDWDKKVCALCPPRTGTRTFRDVLTKQYGFVAVDNHHSTPASFPQDRYAGSDTMYREFCQDGWTVVTFVRNHYDRIASFWRLTQENEMPDLAIDSEDTTKMIHLILQHTRRLKVGRGNPLGFMYFPWTLYATHVLKYEYYEDELVRFLRQHHYNTDNLEIPHVGKVDASSVDYREYFNESTRKKLHNECQYEMNLYGYTW